MQAIIESSPVPTAISQLDARQVAQQYVAAQIDPRFTVNNGEHYNSQSLGRALWRFIICQEQDPLAALMVDAQTGQVIALTQAEIQVVREKAAIYTARKQGVLPVNERGYVLGEYARREASGYLDDNISMFFNAVDPLFLAGPQARWQVTIVFKRYYLGPFTLGVMDVDARTGAPIALTRKQIHQLKERARAIIEFQYTNGSGVNLIVWLLARKWRLSTLVSNKIFINNPFFAVAPIEMSLSNFEAGWEEKRRLYAVIGLTPP